MAWPSDLSFVHVLFGFLLVAFHLLLFSSFQLDSSEVETLLVPLLFNLFNHPSPSSYVPFGLQTCFPGF